MNTSEKPIVLLEQEITAAIDEYKGLRKLNQTIGLGLGISGIAFSFLATVAGIVGTPNAAKLAAGFAAASGALQGALFAYPLDKRSSFYRVLEAKGRNLAIDLKLGQTLQASDQDLAGLVERLKNLRMEAAIEPDSDQKQKEIDRTRSEEPQSTEAATKDESFEAALPQSRN